MWTTNLLFRNWMHFEANWKFDLLFSPLSLLLSFFLSFLIFLSFCCLSLSCSSYVSLSLSLSFFSPFLNSFLFFLSNWILRCLESSSNKKSSCFSRGRSKKMEKVYTKSDIDKSSTPTHFLKNGTRLFIYNFLFYIDLFHYVVQINNLKTFKRVCFILKTNCDLNIENENELILN